MPRRGGYDRRRQCGFTDVDGTRCKEVSIVNYQYKRDYTDAVQREKGKPWLCSRHAHPEQVLSVRNLETSYVTEPSHQREHGKYWEHSGFIYGEGFKAWAKDFPVGTRIVVTARVVLPDGYTAPPPPSAPPRYHTDRIDLDG